MNIIKIFSKIIGIGGAKSIKDYTGETKILEIKVPKEKEENVHLDVAPIAAEHLFASLHGLLKESGVSQEHFSFELVSTGDGIKFYVAAPSNVAKFIESQIYAQYPNAHIIEAVDYIPKEFKHGSYKVANLSLTRPDYFPIKGFRDFEIDPLAAITSAMTETQMGEDVWIQFLIRPIPDGWQGGGYEYVGKVQEGSASDNSSLLKDLPAGIVKEIGKLLNTFFKQLLGNLEDPSDMRFGGSDRVILTPEEELRIESIENKLSKMGFEVVLRILAHAENDNRAESLLRSAVASMRQFSTSSLNSFSSKINKDNQVSFDNYKKRRFLKEESVILNIEELGSIYHLPSATVETPGVSWAGSRRAEPPANLPTEDCNYIGTTVFRDRKIKFGISNKEDDRIRHMYMIGKSGTGKSTCFKTMITQDIADGKGVGVVDPHGDLIEDLLNYIPDNRVDDVVIVDPSDIQHPVGINLLELDDPSQKNLMASALVSSMKQYFWSWGPRLEYLLNYAVLTLLEVPGTSMLGITRLLTDINYQKYILHFVKDPVVLDFWEEEFKHMRGNQQLITQAVAPIQNKINRFLSSTTIRNIVGQKDSTIDFWDIMNSRKILFLNLSKGKIGSDNANLLGALLISRLQFMAMQRVKIPEHERKPFYLYVDEFQNFTGGEFESILSEARKYRLGLYLTHQYTSQLPEELLSAILGNVGTITSFGIGAEDAREMETEFAPYFDENDLISLPKFQVYMKLMINGQTSKPFSAQVLRPWLEDEAVTGKTSNKEEVIRKSQEKYGSDAEYVNAKIRKWVEYPFDKGKAIAQEYRNKAKKKESGEKN